jgi:hypothetical protein
MKKSYVLMTVLLALAGSFSSATYAASITTGRVVALYTDPSDVVVELDTPGSCGSKFFHMQRASLNFKEFTALAMTAASLGKVMTLFQASCAGDRNIISHGGMLTK